MDEREADLQLEGKELTPSSYSVIAHLGCQLPEGYQNMVFSKWLRSLRYGNDYFKLIDTEAYFAVYNHYINAILRRPEVIVRLAVLTDTPDVVFGFSVSENDTLHYVHVHKDARKKGIGTQLVNFQFNTITHITKPGMAIWAAKYPHAKFNPFQ